MRLSIVIFWDRTLLKIGISSTFSSFTTVNHLSYAYRFTGSESVSYALRARMKWSSLSLPALSGWCFLALKSHSLYKQSYIWKWILDIQTPKSTFECIFVGIYLYIQQAIPVIVIAQTTLQEGVGLPYAYDPSKCKAVIMQVTWRAPRCWGEDGWKIGGEIRKDSSGDLWRQERREERCEDIGHERSLAVDPLLATWTKDWDRTNVENEWISCSMHYTKQSGGRPNSLRIQQQSTLRPVYIQPRLTCKSSESYLWDAWRILFILPFPQYPPDRRGNIRHHHNPSNLNPHA